MFAYRSDVRFPAVRIDVSPARSDDLDALLPLFAGYQRFYGAAPDDERNRAFLARFVGRSDDGLLLIASDGDVLGFATLYWTFSSTRAEEHVLMNDLFVVEAARGRGVGRVLVDAAAQAARDRGVSRLSWMTAADNAGAQRLYDRTGAARSAWVEYELEL
jgi:GNAT superfamily N-acetyltransferase